MKVSAIGILGVAVTALVAIVGLRAVF